MCCMYVTNGNWKKMKTIFIHQMSLESKSIPTKSFENFQPHNKLSWKFSGFNKTHFVECWCKFLWWENVDSSFVAKWQVCGSIFTLILEMIPFYIPHSIEPRPEQLHIYSQLSIYLFPVDFAGGLLSFYKWRFAETAH